MSTHPSNETRIKQLNAHLTVSQPYYLAEKNTGNTPQCRKPKVIPKPPAKKNQK
jgi:hypothetical protein